MVKVSVILPFILTINPLPFHPSPQESDKLTPYEPQDPSVEKLRVCKALLSPAPHIACTITS